MTNVRLEPIKRSTLDAKEVAEYLGVSIDTVYKLVREKQLPCVKLGRRILFKIDSIERWFSEQEQNN